MGEIDFANDGEKRMHYSLTTNGPEETREAGKRLAVRLKPGDVLLLVGEMGSGKTTFTQGVAAGLGINRGVNSPTFTLVKEHAGRLPLYHMDLYRLETYEDLGFEEYFEGDGVSVVEWPEVLGESRPPENLTIRFTVEEDRRHLQFTSNGSRYDALLREFIHDYSRD